MGNWLKLLWTFINFCISVGHWKQTSGKWLKGIFLDFTSTKNSKYQRYNSEWGPWNFPNYAIFPVKVENLRLPEKGHFETRSFRHQNSKNIDFGRRNDQLWLKIEVRRGKMESHGCTRISQSQESTFLKGDYVETLKRPTQRLETSFLQACLNSDSILWNSFLPLFTKFLNNKSNRHNRKNISFQELKN